LGTLAERLVNASIYWLYQKCEKETTSENQTTGIKSGSATASVVAIELAKLLLREPKDLAAMYKDSDASNPSFAEATSENIARVYPCLFHLYNCSCYYLSLCSFVVC
jgi:hypothetical protein